MMLPWEENCQSANENKSLGDCVQSFIKVTSICLPSLRFVVSVVCTRRDVVMQSSEVQSEWKKGVPIVTVYIAVDMYIHMYGDNGSFLPC